MRSAPRPRATSSAAPRLCCGTKPSRRAALASRHPAMSTEPTRSAVAAQAVPFDRRQQRVAREPGPVVGDRTGSAPRPLRPHRRAAPPGRRTARGRAPGSGGGTGAAAMDEDHRAVGVDGRLVPPEAEGEAEADVGGGDRVRWLAGKQGGRRRDADDDRVERFGQFDALEDVAAQERLHVRDRRRAAVSRRGGELARQPFEQPPAQASRRELEHPPRRRREQALDRGGVVWIPGKGASRPRRVQKERDARHRDARRKVLLERERKLPAARARRLEQRGGGGCEKRLPARGREQARRAAGEHRLRGRDREHEVRLHEGTVHPQRHTVRLAELDEVVGLGVVHHHAAPEPSAKVGGNEQADLARCRAPGQPAGDEGVTRVTPSRSSSSAAAAIAVWRGPIDVFGIGRVGCSITSVAVPPSSRAARAGRRRAGTERIAGGAADVVECFALRRAARGRRRAAHLGHQHARVGEERRPRHVACRAAAAVTPSAMNTPPET